MIQLTFVKFGILDRKDDDYLSIIERLLIIIKEKGLKPADLCKAIDINTSTMTNWKQRNTDPPAKYIIPICEFLEITPYYLLTGKNTSFLGLSANEQELISSFRKLDSLSQGRLLGRAETMLEQNEITQQGDEHEALKTAIFPTKEIISTKKG